MTKLRACGIVCESVHHGNTWRVAESLARALDADLHACATVAPESLGEYDLLGLGSGIYFGRHHRTLRALAAAAPRLPRRVFLFSTAGLASLSGLWHGSLRRLLRRRGCTVVGEFCCPGWDTVGPLRLVGGIHWRRPNARDLANAGRFAEGLGTGCQA